MLTTLLAAPAGEPIALAELRGFLKLETNDDDALLALLITAARLQVETLTGLALLDQSWRVDAAGGSAEVRLPVRPVKQLLAAPDGAELSGDRVVLAPAEEQVRIDFVAGYGGAADVPADLRQAVMALASYWYENRDLATAPPAAIERMLANYRQVRL